MGTLIQVGEEGEELLPEARPELGIRWTPVVYRTSRVEEGGVLPAVSAWPSLVAYTVHLLAGVPKEWAWSALPGTQLLPG